MFKPSVTIGIPTFSCATAESSQAGHYRLRRCLKSIEDHTDFDAFASVKVLVCDDGSNEENLNLNKNAIHERVKLRTQAGLEMLVSEQNAGVSASWNKLVRHQDSDVAVLINDDIEVVDDWLDVLTFSVWENKHAGMVGLNSYVGVVKQDVIGRLPLRIDYQEANLLDGGGSLLASAGSIFAFRREVFDEAGGFDERYKVYYEECDFGVTLRRLGYSHYMASYPIVFHMGGATMSQPSMDAQRHLARSRVLFAEKWGSSPNELRTALPELDNVRTREWNTQLKFLSD